MNQYALFSLLSQRRPPRSTTGSSDTPELACRIVIPAELKWEMRDKLDQANMTERVLFPGLDGTLALGRPATTRRDDAGARAEFDAGPEKLTQG